MRDECASQDESYGRLGRSRREHGFATKLTPAAAPWIGFVKRSQPIAATPRGTYPSKLRCSSSVMMRVTHSSVVSSWVGSTRSGLAGGS